MSDLSAGPQYLGLAHYTEHAMYMGSKEYPRFSEFSAQFHPFNGCITLISMKNSIALLLSLKMDLFEFHQT